MGWIRERVSMLWGDCGFRGPGTLAEDVRLDLRWGPGQAGFRVRVRSGGDDARRISACMTQRGTAWVGDVPRAFHAELFVPKQEPPQPYP